MKRPKPAVVDFESFAVQDRPSYPPVPTSVSIKLPGGKVKCYAWGHASDNNCTWPEAREALAEAWATKDGVCFHHAKFDCDVAETHFSLEPLPWDKVHDTLILAYLDDPHQRDLGLKPTAERLLGEAPEERDEVVEWLVANQPIPGAKISRAKQSQHYAMKYLPFAPGGLVGKYANGDVSRTAKLFDLLWPKTQEREMLIAYDRERRLTPLLLAAERRGLWVDLPGLAKDLATYSGWLIKIDAYLVKRLKSPDVNLDSGDQLLAALLEAGLADRELIGLTAKGKLASDKKTLMTCVKDKALGSLLAFRAELCTCLRTYMGPWMVMAEATGGSIHTQFNQTKSPDGGTRTGRLSCTWFMNMPKAFEPLFKDEKHPKLPSPPKGLEGLPALPRVRGYIIPRPGHVFIDRDYCFSPDTEVLTEHGFVRFDQLPEHVKLAQWNDGVIDYADRLGTQVVPFNGELVRIYGKRHVDLLVTPNHRCLVEKNGTEKFVTAEEYPLGNRHKQLNAGLLLSSGRLGEVELRLAVSMQADATIKGGTRVVWKLKKARKKDCLREILSALEIPYTETVPPSQPDFSVFRVYLDQLPGDVFAAITPTSKTFNRESLLSLAVPLRRVFLEELKWWDGRRNGATAWSYFSTNEVNVEIVQELAVVTDLRSNLSWQDLPSGKRLGSVNMSQRTGTWTDTFVKQRVPYSGLTYCVTTPHGTVIVRRNGHVCITGQCQQEPRILAHFDGEDLMRAYTSDPWVDFHDYAKAELEKVGLFYERKPVKNTNLGLIYGMGVGKLAEKNDMAVPEAKGLKEAVLRLYPGLKGMYKDMKQRAKDGVPIRTWGGREYYCQPPAIVDGRIREFDYKMVNQLVQGSAADCTKEAIIVYHEAKEPESHFLLPVHDQMLAETPIKLRDKAMETLRAAMENIAFDVPMLSEGDWSAKSWADLQTYDKKGKRVCSNNQ